MHGFKTVIESIESIGHLVIVLLIGRDGRASSALAFSNSNFYTVHGNSDDVKKNNNMKDIMKGFLIESFRQWADDTIITPFLHSFFITS